MAGRAAVGAGRGSGVHDDRRRPPRGYGGCAAVHGRGGPQRGPDKRRSGTDRGRSDGGGGGEGTGSRDGAGRGAGGEDRGNIEAAGETLAESGYGRDLT